jgi:hypothetical protein
LVNKLSKAKEDPNIEKKMKRASVKFMTDEVVPAKADVVQYQLVPLMPELVLREGAMMGIRAAKTMIFSQDDPFEILSDDERLKHLFVIDLCALLRILYNGATYMKNHLVIKHLLNDKHFMTQMNKACNFAGWHNGFLSSKFLRLVKFAVHAEGLSSADDKSGKFCTQTGYYHLVFKSLSNVLDYFLQKFKKENLKVFRNNEISLLYEIIKTAVTAMMTVKAAIISDVAGGDSKQGKDGDAKHDDHGRRRSDRR